MEVAHERHRLGGMTGFALVWFGQIVSILASGMTQFALTIWMYEQTKSAFALGLMQVFYITPFLIVSPIAGVMVDRYNRKLMMMVSDLAAGLGTLAVLILWSQGRWNSGCSTSRRCCWALAAPSSGRPTRPPSLRWSPRKIMGAPTA